MVLHNSQIMSVPPPPPPFNYVSVTQYGVIILNWANSTKNFTTLNFVSLSGCMIQTARPPTQCFLHTISPIGASWSVQCSSTWWHFYICCVGASVLQWWYVCVCVCTCVTHDCSKHSSWSGFGRTTFCAARVGKCGRGLAIMRALTATHAIPRLNHSGAPSTFWPDHFLCS